MKKIGLLVVLSLPLFGCSIFNPYASDFSCPDGFRGKCISVKGAYSESKADVDDGKLEVEKEATKKCSTGACSHADAGGKETPEERNYSAYRSALYTKLNKLLKEPKTPVVAPPKVMRVLLLPYKGQDGEFYMMRHVYFFVDEPRWVLGDSIEALEE